MRRCSIARGPGQDGQITTGTWTLTVAPESPGDGRRGREDFCRFRMARSTREPSRASCRVQRASVMPCALTLMCHVMRPEALRRRNLENSSRSISPEIECHALLSCGRYHRGRILCTAGGFVISRVCAKLLVIFLPAQVVPLDSAPPAKPRGLEKRFQLSLCSRAARVASPTLVISSWTSKAWRTSGRRHTVLLDNCSLGGLTVHGSKQCDRQRVFLTLTGVTLKMVRFHGNECEVAAES